MVVSPPSRAWRSAPREAHWLGALRSPGLLALLGAFLFVGMALGSITVAAVSYADEHGGDAVYGWLMAALGLGALVGGSVYGARQWAGPPERRLRVLVALLAVCYLPLMLMPGAVAMAALAALAGVFLAPVIACAFVIVDRHAPTGHGDRGVLLAGDDVHRGRVGRYGRWRVRSVECGRGAVGFAVAGCRGGRCAAGSAGHGAGPRSSRRGVRLLRLSSENDPNRAAEPRFSSGDRA